MSIRLIAVDLDGTFLREDHITVSQRNIQAIKLAVEKGVIPVIASGRTLSIMRSVIKQVPFIQYAVISNGASALEIGVDKPMFVDGIPYEKWVKICNIMEKNHSIYEIFYNTKSYMEKDMLSQYKNPYLTKEFLEDLKSGITACDNFKEDLNGCTIEKISSIYTPEEFCDSLEKEILQYQDMEITTSVPGNMELNMGGVNKGTGLKRLCDILKIQANEVMAFGDADNDCAMLQWAGYSFAMGNASEEVKKCAKYIADTNINDGVAKAIEAYVLGEE